MKETILLYAILGLFVFGLGYPATAQVTAERILPTHGYIPEQTIFIEIIIQGETGNYSITESLPVGWVIPDLMSDGIPNISHNGTLENGIIQWSLRKRSARTAEVLNYRLVVPADAVGDYDFVGTVNGQRIAGQSTLIPHSTAGKIENHWINSLILKNAGQSANRELTVYLPEEYAKGDRRYPVLYLIHGYSGTNWTFLGNGYPYFSKLINEIYVDNIVDRLIADGAIQPLIVAFPNVNRNILELNGVYKQYLIDEVIELVDRTYRTIPHRDSRIITGHSLGGHDALDMAVEYPNLFSLIGMYSAYYTSPPLIKMFADHNQQIFPLRFWISVGMRDDWSSIPFNTRALVEILGELELPFEYVEDDTDHWIMIGQRIEESIKFFSNHVVYDTPNSAVIVWSHYK